MAEKSKSKGGGKLSRSEVVTVRFDPKLRYALDLGARAHRRTVSSFIEWAVEKALVDVPLCGATSETTENVLEWLPKLWDIDHAERVWKLANNFPNLLTFEEERAALAIAKCPLVFGASVDFKIVNLVWEELLAGTWEVPSEEEMMNAYTQETNGAKLALKFLGKT
jgi:hypothetical protein